MSGRSEAPKLTPQFIEPVSSYADMTRVQAKLARGNEASAFKLRAQLLDQGRSETVLAAMANLTVRLKVYASGGENVLHAHSNEDHVFIILQGAAEFHDEGGLLASLGPNEGVSLPKGKPYRFHASSPEPLVMLRIGSPNESALGLEGRIGTDGEPMAGDSPQNKAGSARVFRPGAFYG
jgi:mannose-6-phosphate isomerase-like protein (cupin superfamily)